MELKLIISNTYYLAKTRFFKFFIGLIKAKLSAIFLGTFGVGILSQINFTNSQLSKFTLLGMNDGLVKQIASRKEEYNFREIFLNSIKSYLVIVLLSFLIVLFLLFFFSENLTIYFFGDIKYYRYYLISVICLPILILNSLSFALLKSFKEIKLIAHSQMLGIFLSFICFVPMVYYFELTGAIIVSVITVVITFVLNHIYSNRQILNKFSITYKEVLKEGKISKSDLSELFMFAGYGLSIGFYQMFTVIASRSIIINQLGIDSIGLYAPNRAWGGLFTGIITQTLFTYLYPRFSEAKDDIEIKEILNDVFRLISFSMIPFLFIGIAFREIIIPLFYSISFIEAAKYLPGHFIGILFTMWMYAFTQVFTPTGRIKIYVFFLFIMYSMNILLVYYLTPIVGLYAWMLKFIVTPVIFFFIFYFYLRKYMSFSFHKKNLLIMLYVVFSSIILFLITELNMSIGYIISILLLLLSWLFLKDNERNTIIEKIKSMFSK